MDPFLLWLGLFVLSLGSAVPATSAPDSQAAAAARKHLTFDCSDGQVGDTCMNMCFGSRFAWNLPMTLPKCDEYPLKSVKEADKGNRVSRCVKGHYNSRQEKVLQNFYYSHGDFKNRGCGGKALYQFSIAVKRFSKHKYCKKKPNCKNDEDEHTKAGPAKREDDVEPGGYYRLASGEVIFVPDGAQVGDLVYQATFTNITIGVADNEGVVDSVKTAAENDEDESYSDDEFEVQEDRIVEEVVNYE
ncbi:hypothetical protein BDV29DRAFT_190993 [Aspergillus leporis]|uniref:Deoxyribonuclease NucA/NucB domain-containing protein n=1 Tax=Aspergillus leporis TaxID=41062 RepID=A0A5N5X0W5_9EURO|nr:hypothetical protein BDV29DRAFT_190993 [Aspergillus leporis]